MTSVRGYSTPGALKLDPGPKILTLENVGQLKLPDDGVDVDALVLVVRVVAMPPVVVAALVVDCPPPLHGRHCE